MGVEGIEPPTARASVVCSPTELPLPVKLYNVFGFLNLLSIKKSFCFSRQMNPIIIYSENTYFSESLLRPKILIKLLQLILPQF